MIIELQNLKDFLLDDIGGGVRRIDDKIVTVMTDWGIASTVFNGQPKVSVSVGFNNAIQYPSISILPDSKNYDLSFQFYQEKKTTRINLMVEASALDNQVCLKVLAVYVEAVTRLINLNKSLNNRVAVCMVTAEAWGDAVVAQKNNQVIQFAVISLLIKSISQFQDDINTNF